MTATTALYLASYNVELVNVLLMVPMFMYKKEVMFYIGLTIQRQCMNMTMYRLDVQRRELRDLKGRGPWAVATMCLRP